VKFYNTSKNFGLITPDDGGKDVFVHATGLFQAQIPALFEGDRVSIRGGKASSVKRLAKA
jgi:cold shock protein